MVCIVSESMDKPPAQKHQRHRERYAFAETRERGLLCSRGVVRSHAPHHTYRRPEVAKPAQETQNWQRGVEASVPRLTRQHASHTSRASPEGWCLTVGECSWFHRRVLSGEMVLHASQIDTVNSINLDTAVCDHLTLQK